MGYQESLVKFKDNKAFDEAVLYLEENEPKLDIFIAPCTLVTFKEKVSVNTGFFKTIFNAGEKSICMQGERFANNSNFVFENNPKLASKAKFIYIEELGLERCEKLFKTHELAHEQEFKKYLLQLKRKELEFERAR